MSPPRGESVLTMCVHGESARPRVSAVNLGCRWEKCQLRHWFLWTASGTARPALNDLLFSVHIPGQPLAIFLSPLPISTQEHGS